MLFAAGDQRGPIYGTAGTAEPSTGGAPATGGTGPGGSSTGASPATGGTGGACQAVPCPATCDHGFEIKMHLHGGCAVCECGPVDDCSSDLDCPSGSRCFEGVQCDDGCASPDCCSGNHCAKPSCPAPTTVTCLAVGCPAGDVCSAACDSARCSCDGANWTCTYDAGAVTSCASACLLP